MKFTKVIKADENDTYKLYVNILRNLETLKDYLTALQQNVGNLSKEKQESLMNDFLNEISKITNKYNL